MMHSFKAMAAGVILGFGALPALAQDVPTFDCSAAINLLAGGGKRTMTGIDEQPVTLVVPAGLESRITNPNDPVSLIEDWDGAGPIIAHSAQPLDDGMTLSCAFMLAEFRVGESSETGSIGDLIRDKNNYAARYPILLLQKVNNSGVHSRFFSVWRDRSYRIGVLFKPFSSVGRTLAESRTFTQAVFLGPRWRGAPGKVNHVSFDMAAFLNGIASDDLKDRLTPFTAVGEISRGAIMLCEPDCKSFEGLQATAPQQNVPLETPLAPTPQAAPGEIEQALKDVVNDEKPSVGAGAVSFGLFYERKTGDLRPVDPSVFGSDGFACLIEGLTPNATIFSNAPVCKHDEISGIAGKAVLVEIGKDGSWILKPGAALVTPDTVSVRLPAGADPNRCTPDFVYISTSGQQETVLLDPVPSSPGLFAGHFQAPIAQQNGSVTGTIKVNSVAACGSEDQVVTLPAAFVLDVQLGGDVGEARGIAYLFAQNANALDDKIGPFSSQAEQVVRPIVLALGDAHDRMIADHGDKPWLLTMASFEQSDPRGPIPLTELNEAVLRDQVGRRLKETLIDRSGLSSVADTRLPNRPDDIRRQILPLANNASANGLKRLDIMMIGTLADNSTDTLPDVCNDPLYTRIPEIVSEIDNVEVNLHIFPLLKLRPGQDGVLPDMRPMALSASAPGGLGGPYACASRSKHVQVYPFVVESWRSAEPAMVRYGVALGDQVYSVLEDIVK